MEAVHSAAPRKAASLNVPPCSLRRLQLGKFGSHCSVRDDVRAKLRSSIKRLLVRFGYPPDKQPEAIKLVMEQMESMAPRFAEARL
ncbi:type I restriction enzyme endonuclease domain-containing protein [Arthrobacter sp. NtRootA1]|uniref:type I restriction enzyme endonuclease domain-containing protein n=1 Tax=Arthrobacter sp. NtRootA1 TaxID=2830983 RepID=UPI001CC6AB5D|nr:type I restriction enzyme endonuclease domain-containing protein [Arthrobacter sp. NtRootA1]